MLAPIRALLQRIQRVIAICRYEAELDACVPQFTYQMFVRQIVNAVRDRTRNTPEYQDHHNGCIRITINPLSEVADRWLSGMSFRSTWLEGGEKDVCEQEFVFKLDPRGSHTSFNDDKPINCYAYSAMKTAYTSYEYKMSISGGEEYFPYLTEENGWSTKRGSVCTTMSINGQPFIRFYICVHSDKDLVADEHCSLFGMRSVQNYARIRTKQAITFNPAINDQLGREWPSVGSTSGMECKVSES